MTTVATRVGKIAAVEGFRILVKRRGKAVKLRRNGVLGPYPFEKMLKHSKTVGDYRRDRFDPTYPGYTCDVLNGNGKVVPPQTTLRRVRASYR